MQVKKYVMVTIVTVVFYAPIQLQIQGSYFVSQIYFVLCRAKHSEFQGLFFSMRRRACWQKKKNSLCALTIFHKNGRRILKVYSFSVHETGSDQSHRTHLGLSGVIKIATTYETKQCQMLIEELKLLWCFLQLCQQQFMINETCRP